MPDSVDSRKSSTKSTQNKDCKVYSIQDEMEPIKPRVVKDVIRKENKKVIEEYYDDNEDPIKEYKGFFSKYKKL